MDKLNRKETPAGNSGWQMWRFRSPQTQLWLIKVWFFASTFAVKVATFAKPQNVCVLNECINRTINAVQKMEDSFKSQNDKSEV